MAEPDRIEARLDRDEARLAFDAARLDEESEEIRESRLIAKTGIAFAVVLAIAVTALVFSVVALRGDVRSLARGARGGRVAPEAIQDAAVSSTKLSSHAVVRGGIADGAVGSQQLA